MARFNFLHDPSIMLLLGIKHILKEKKRFTDDGFSGEDKKIEHYQDPIYKLYRSECQTSSSYQSIVGYISIYSASDGVLMEQNILDAPSSSSLTPSLKIRIS